MVSLESVNLNLLVPLDVLLRTRNVTQAGKELHLSQPATSEVLARLRRTFGDQLLVRSGRSLVLTPFAESLQDQVHEALRLIDHLMRTRPDFDPQQDERDFSLIASDYVATVVLRPLLSRLAEEAPAVTFTLTPLRDDFESRIRHDEVDALLVSEGICRDRLDGLPRQLLFTDVFVLCGWRGSRALSSELDARTFERLPYVQYGTGLDKGLADQGLAELQVRPKVELRTESQLLVPFLLHGSDLVALVPQRLAVLTYEAAQLVVQKPPFKLPVIEQALVWHPRRAADPAHTWLRDTLHHVSEPI